MPHVYNDPTCGCERCVSHRAEQAAELPGRTTREIAQDLRRIFKSIAPRHRTRMDAYNFERLIAELEQRNDARGTP